VIRSGWNPVYMDTVFLVHTGRRWCSELMIGGRCINVYLIPSLNPFA
jgi:hypothetical protein